MKTIDHKTVIYHNQISKMVDFVIQTQILNRAMWKNFIEVFKDKTDSEDLRWRGEYFGKTMRGACLVYQFNKSKEIYDILKETVSELLNTQDELGRISTYKVDNEFKSWDIWCRKYVLTGLLHFYDVSKDAILKNQILTAACKHVDYLIDKIGDKPNQTRITSTSDFWLGVNSSSILEPIVDLYKKTNDKKYLDFATYIVNEGGIKDNNLLDIVRSRRFKPSEYPEQKAYETMSFFEGVYEYSKIVHDKDLFNTSLQFFEDVNQYEISIIGNAGTNEECFSDTVINQLTKQSKFMQETCVVVTWMRMCAKLFLDTGDIKYYERFIKAGLNCFYGSLNYESQKGYEYYQKREIKPLPFDSYSPLLFNRRGLSTGGLNFFKDGTSYGCCACIGAAGVGLLANLSFVEDDKFVYINEYFNGEMVSKTTTITINGDYFNTGIVNLNIQTNKKIKVRIPEWSKRTIINGKEINETGYYLLGDESSFEIKFDLNIKVHHLDDYVTLTYGDITLGLDDESNPNINIEDIKFSEIKDIKVDKDKASDFVSLEGKIDNKSIIIKDYASLGKHWNSNSILTAWFKN